MPRAWLSIGSNIDREHNIRGAIGSLQAIFGELVLSSIYESQAVGFDGDPFYNLVAGLETTLPADRLNAHLREIEQRHGRVRSREKFAPRTLDIDLLLYGDQIIDEGGVTVPRDEIGRYAFVLQPLAEVAGQTRDPVTGRTYQELWDAFDQGQQRLWRVELDPGVL